MSGRKIIAIGFDDLHNDSLAEFYDHDDLVSLDDADIILFRPSVTPGTYEQYKGKPSLPDNDSFQYKRLLEHWRSELERAVLSGKTVFIALGAREEAYAGTGNKEYSGTGRNARTTRLVGPVSNYSAIPLEFANLQDGYGVEMRLHAKGKPISQYWNRFGKISAYEVRFGDKAGWQPLATTKVLDAIVSAVIKDKSGGHIVLLPRVAVPQKPASESKKASLAFIHELLNIDSELRGVEDAVPPDWLNQIEFATARIQEKANETLRLQNDMRELERRREAIERELVEAHLLQSLLYGQSKGLERAVLYALGLMGIQAANYTDGESEFDAVFDIGGTRLLGEAEGKDNTAINIDKISQLERNVAEDFQREDVHVHAKGVLFGNPQRLVPPGQRSMTFTEKCVASAKRNQFSLVLTFHVQACSLSRV